jgi:YidC/Oxa1 family membrane protein insertase
MAEAWGQILRFLGAVLNSVYQVIPSYGVAIVILTIITRLILFPLGVKQVRSMTAMQKIQPKMKELQKKHKGDRQRLNEEMMKLYREHGVNPLGGCFPMLLQMPVFIALYAVIRAAVPFTADLATPVKAEIAITRNTICRPVGEQIPDGPGHTEIRCEAENGASQTFAVASVAGRSGPTLTALPWFVTRCGPATQTDPVTKEKTVARLGCTSTVGTGHLPKDGKLFKAIAQDKATFLGMHLACSPTQATSKKSIRQCTAAENAGGGASLVAYFSLIVLMAGTTYFQQKQMTSRAPAGPQAQQMQLMGRIMPVFMGFLSLNFPAALSLYWVIGNFWMIGQQHIILRSAAPPEGGTPAKPGDRPKPATPNSPPKGKDKPGKRGR